MNPGEYHDRTQTLQGLGGADHGWLKAKHHFSFADYYDPARMGWGALRVWNDDEIAPNTGFPPHPHADMEIITYVREGAITHQDSLGNKGRTEAGDVQVMSAGSGVRTPNTIWSRRRPASSRSGSSRPRGRQALLGRQAVSEGRPLGPFVTLASGFAADDDALPIRADARVLGATLKAGESAEYTLGKRATPIWCRRKVRSRSTACALNARDGVAISDEEC